MFNSKPLWWTVLISWIIGSCYWHVCRIKQLCDAFGTSKLPYPTSRSAGLFSYARRYEIMQFEVDLYQLTIYALMISVTLILGFFTGNSYHGKKHQDLTYRLNRVNRELKFYRPNL